jgi:hypothetical protein
MTDAVLLPLAGRVPEQPIAMETDNRGPRPSDVQSVATARSISDRSHPGLSDYGHTQRTKRTKQTSCPIVSKRTVPAERPPLVGEIWCQLL